MDISGVYYCSKCMLQMEEEGVCPHCGYAPGQAGRDRKQLEEGTFLNERYLLGAVIGSGGFGITYAAWDTLLEAPVAIKEYFPRDYAERDVRDGDEVLPRNNYETEYKLGLRRFMQEARVLAMFREVRGIVNVSDCFEENETFYFVMEYVRGVSLKEYVKKHHTGPQELLGMMRSTIDALEAVHSMGILHRDITPQNLMVLEDGSVKLIDFGAARKIDREGSSIIVTEHYAPIEQYESSRGQGPWTDIYSLCATIYEMLTGAAPQESLARKYSDELNPPSKAGVRLKKYQEHALMNGLAVEPAKRIRSMAELRSRLYNLPLPEEILRRKAFVRKVSAVSALILAVCAILAINFTTGLPVYRGLMLSLMPDGWHIIDCHTEEEAYIIPEKCLGIPITVLEEESFADSDSLYCVDIPNSVKTIDKQAFFGCDRLERVIVGEGTRNINAYAFASCPQLHTAEIRANSANISATAFDGVWERFTLWGSDDSSAKDYAQDNGFTFANPAQYKYAYNEDMQGVAILEISAQETAADTLVIPSYIDGMKVVMLDANVIFPDVKNLVMPLYLEHMGEGICFPSELMQIDLGSALLEIPADAFVGTKLVSVNIPDTVQLIGSRAFMGTRLDSVSLPESMEFIGNEAFRATRLHEITLPAFLEEIGENVFADTLLYAVDFPEGTQTINSGYFQNCSKLTYVALPHGVKTIQKGAFENCTNLDQIIIPSSVTGIHEAAFEGCDYFLIISDDFCAAADYTVEHKLAYLPGLKIMQDTYSTKSVKASALPFLLPVAQFETEAVLGNPEAIFALGLNHLYVYQDTDRAFELFSAAADLGYADAQAYLGMSYYAGYCVDKDNEQAFYWFSKAAEQGNIYAQYNLGTYYQEGVDGSEPDHEKAFYWFSKAAEQGYARAQTVIGGYYATGAIGMAPDFDQAFKWFSLAAQQGEAYGQYNLGLLYLGGTGVDQNDDTAFYWFSLAAENGHSDAQYTLGVYYQDGRGSVIQDIEQAIYWYTLAAEQGEVDAQYNLGNLYATGNGVSQSYEQAFYWHSLAAQQNDAMAQFAVGSYYRDGLYVDQDYEQAAHWFTLAAEQDLAEAQLELGYLYLDGKGVPQDSEKAFRLFATAAE